jgi:hypothetical protein
VRAALADTKRQVRAVAARGIEWWDSADANAYWRAYEEVANRLKVTRVFVLQEGQDTAAIRRVLDRHDRGGMRALVISASHVPAQHIKPIVIFDDRLVHRAASDREANDDSFRVQFSSRPSDVADAEETFHVVLDLAEEGDGKFP